MLKEKGANNIYLVATFSLFTEGVEIFDKAYEEKLFTKLYTTNLTYVPENIKSRDWIKEVDMSKYMALIINALHNRENINKLKEAKVLVKRK
jgi:ribose-phosphate pyrophosphokinase